MVVDLLKRFEFLKFLLDYTLFVRISVQEKLTARKLNRKFTRRTWKSIIMKKKYQNPVLTNDYESLSVLKMNRMRVN